MRSPTALTFFTAAAPATPSGVQASCTAGRITAPRQRGLLRLELAHQGTTGWLRRGCATLAREHACVPVLTVNGHRLRSQLPQHAVRIQGKLPAISIADAYPTP